LFFLAVFFSRGYKIPYHPSTATQRGAPAHRKMTFFQDLQNPNIQINSKIKIDRLKKLKITITKKENSLCSRSG